VLLTAAVVLLAFSPGTARERSAEVKLGREIRASGPLWNRKIASNHLGLNVREVRVVWRDRHTPRLLALGQPTMLLGAAGDLYFIYDVERRRTVRIPRDLALVYNQD
jgi:hypothetical protein